MRNFLTLLVCLLTAGTTLAQAEKQVLDPSNNGNPMQQLETPIMEPTATTQGPSQTTPVGTTVSDAVTAVKIGEASNAFTFIQVETNQVGVAYNVGTNGGAVSFIHRQNIANCGGDNGIYRYALSEDGGLSWNVGPGINTPGGTIATGCYGLGPLNPAYLQNSRYPNMMLSTMDTSATAITDLKVAYAGPVLSPSGTGWDGVVLGTAKDVTTTPVVTDEDYPYSNGNYFFAYSLVERVPGEFWFISETTVDGTAGTADVLVTKGVYNATTEEVDWSLAATLQPDHYIGYDGDPKAASWSIGFSPDGTVGYIAGVGDLVGAPDTTFSPWASYSFDSGATWSQPEEIALTAFPELSDLLQSFFIVVDSMSPTQIDTLPAGGGFPTTAFDLDMVVDKNGNPHIITVVGNAKFYDLTTHSYEFGASAYSIFSGIEMFILDVTRDQFGDWNAVPLAAQNFLRGAFGDPASGTINFDPWVQASRSEDGSYVFFSWTDTDPANSSTGNDAPDMFGIGYDIDNQLLTDVIDWTSDDNNWASQALGPKISDRALFDGNCTYTIPTVIMDLGDGDAYTAVDFWYFTDVTYDACNDFVNPAEFFFNCKSTPFTNTVNPTAPACGASDGSLTVVAGGGTPPYAFEWDANAGGGTSATVSNLAAGQYTVIVTDSNNCADVITTTLESAGAATVAIDNQTNVSCAGLTDGAASLMITGGTAPYTYLWSNGESTDSAMMLPSGPNTVEVTDSNGCVSFATVFIVEPAELSLNASGSAVDCPGDSSGTASVLATGGTPGYTYAWSNGGNTADLTGIPAGTYSVTVTDANGCTSNESAIVTGPSDFAINFQVIPNIGGTPDTYSGQIVTSVSGGTAPYTFAWVGGTTDTSGVGLSNLNQLCGATYYLTLTDANGCVTTDSVEVGVALDGVTCMTISNDPYLAGFSSISVYPNPTHGLLNLDLEMKDLQSVTVDVMNANGQIVLRHAAGVVGQLQHTLDLSNQAAGIYLVRISTPAGSVTRKVLLD
ncbi:T9SS type A sorting domain-containing protein [Pontibacter sp. G13]|uniref:T9SS type A sorting domain-containing protein n=1 Tax=Pontibacter sp. G13 TaxID=3074898 RepID=UPI002889B48C|nr:T9SS type A sorting domain-containing protein [Pontibacter sp. G13]WNJ18558.1 T9SS type A sorting domain-containing protein [Pontibacter sp. G13]